MIPTKELRKAIQCRSHNNHQMLTILNVCRERMAKQGIGAVIDGYGTVYFDPLTKHVILLL